jgi:hypothetical protein
MPFTAVRITTLVTPNLDPPEQSHYDGSMQSLFWPQVQRQDFQFHLVAEDNDAGQIDFTAPLLFVAKDANLEETMGLVAGDYEHGVTGPGETGDKVLRRERPINGQVMAFAPRSASAVSAGSTSFETHKLILGALVPTAAQAAERIERGLPCFYPAMRYADISIADLKHLAGHTGRARISYPEVYLRHGLLDDSNNPGEVFAQLPEDEPIELNFADQADRSGALVTPNMKIAGLSRQVGPAPGALEDVAEDRFDPQKVFKDTVPKLLGVIELSQFLSVGGRASCPSMHTEEESDLTSYTWVWEIALAEPKPDPDPDPEPVKKSIFQPKTGSRLFLEAKTLVKRDGGEPVASVLCLLEGFKLNLIPPANFFVLDFNHIQFHSERGRKAEVDVELAGVDFGRDLAFLRPFTSLIPLDGFEDPPAVDVTAEGIAASYSLALPTLAFGVFSMHNLSLAAALSVPFNEAPVSVRFNFCERHSPFLLAVSMFAGGGFFAISASTDDVQVEAALEFGALISINFGVASGSLYAMGGIYFAKATDENDVTTVELSGYFRLGGELDVLGLISASVELYLALSKVVERGAVGSATLSIEVEVAFFSRTVEIRCERQFAGGDPDFGQTMGPYYIDPETRRVYGKDPAADVLIPLRPGDDPPPGAVRVNPWFEYCDAFAGKE